MHFIAECGSTHMNKKEYIQEFIEKSLEHGASSVKFQLFPDTKEFTSTGNIAITNDNFEYAMKLAPGKVTASVFNFDSLTYLLCLNPPYVKFAFSKRNQLDWIEKCLLLKTQAIVTTTIWDGPPNNKDIIKLITGYERDGSHTDVYGNQIFSSIYPNPYLMDFSGLFPEYFQGYSDHSIGWHNAYQAKLAGAQYVEKHLKLDKSDIVCPDAVFASSEFNKIRHFT